MEAPIQAGSKNDQTNIDHDDNVAIAKRRKKLQRLARILLFLPYFVGITWTCLHPIVSIITGELKCRGWYLDEHSIETRFTEGQESHLVPPHLKDLQLVSWQKKENGPYSLCDFFAKESEPGFNANNLICHTHGDHFEVALIKPLSNAIDVSEEAVVLVVPSPHQIYHTNIEKRDWNHSSFHQAMVQSIKHLADPNETPWLAKAVLVVTPTMNSGSNQSLEDTVSLFLDAHSGEQFIPQDYQKHRQRRMEPTVPPLPPKLSGAILRNLVVFQISNGDTFSTTDNRRSRERPKTALMILPQGRRGVLPNADLVFLVGRLLEQTFFRRQSAPAMFLAHPYAHESNGATTWIHQQMPLYLRQLTSDKQLTQKIMAWAQGMFDLSLFAKTMAVGPFPPHAPALERGIDSLTIRVNFEGAFQRDPAVELVQYSEYIVRSLANLHERLHHSFTLYLLPTPKNFVSHIEYLLPTILVLLPLAVRAFGILLPEMKGGMDLTAVGGVFLVLGIAVVAMVLVDAVFDTTDGHTMSGVLIVLYAGLGVFWVQKILHRKRKNTLRTLHYMVCALTVYILVPIAFAHASLAYLPSLLWTPLFAFPGYASGTGASRKVVLVVLVLVTAPPTLLVPGVFSTYTAFVRFVYMPIHALFFLLATSVIAS